MLRTLGRLAGSVVALSTVIAQAQFRQINLVSDGFSPAARQDANLKNPWGLAAGPTTPLWTVNNGSGYATVYDGVGNLAFPETVWLPGMLSTPSSRDRSRPTGATYNTTGQNFIITMGGLSAPAKMLMATEDGTISGWNPALGDARAVMAVNHSARMGATGPSSFRGLAMASSNGRSFLYATNFSNGTVDVFDDRFHLIDQFTDPSMDLDFAPFGITNVGGNLVVTYAKRGPLGNAVIGNGEGFVDVFGSNGKLIKRLVSRVGLNAPWGIALAPSTDVKFPGALLVGNSGDGKIHAYNMATGVNLGAVADRSGIPIEIEGLWALQYGNGVAGAGRNELFFTAGPGGGAHGLFGKLVHGGPTPVNLKSAGAFAIFAGTGIANATFPAAITGHMGVGPGVTSTAITGFALNLPSGSPFSTSAQVTGRVYAFDYAAPTPTMVTTASTDMLSAYNDAAGRQLPNFLNLGSGNLGGRTLTPGLYKWGTAVTLPFGTNVTLSGGPDDVWIFQIAGTLTTAAATNMVLSGGAKAKNVFWQVAGSSVTLGANSHFEGVVLAKFAINFGNGASANSRLFAQTAVNLDKNAVTRPTP